MRGGAKFLPGRRASASRGLSTCITGSFRLHHGEFPAVSRVLPGCITGTFRLHHACCPAASREMFVCITRVTDLHHGRCPSDITRESLLTSRLLTNQNTRDVQTLSRVMSDGLWTCCQKPLWRGWRKASCGMIRQRGRASLAGCGAPPPVSVRKGDRCPVLIPYSIRRNVMRSYSI